MDATFEQFFLIYLTFLCISKQSFKYSIFEEEKKKDFKNLLYMYCISCVKESIQKFSLKKK